MKISVRTSRIGSFVVFALAVATDVWHKNIVSGIVIVGHMIAYGVWGGIVLARRDDERVSVEREAP